MHIQYDYIYTWRNPICSSYPLPLSPCTPLCPFVSPSTYLAPSSCDRNRPPPSQIACKLTPFTQLTHPSQIPRTPPAPRLTTTTSRIFRLLLSGTPLMTHLNFRWTTPLRGAIHLYNIIVLQFTRFTFLVKMCFHSI